jgi:hypothetical protein
MKLKLVRPDDSVIDLLRKTGDLNSEIAHAAQLEYAESMETLLRKTVLVGGTLEGIYQGIPLEKGATAEYPIDMLAPGMENEHVAYTNPGHGRIPERSLESDYIAIPTYNITSSVDWLLRYSEEAKWDVAARGLEIMRQGFVKKANDDGWHTLIAAGVDRNILVYDANAPAGMFTKRLISLLQNTMRRNAGGNSGSSVRGKLTDLYVSPEALQDVKNWGLDQVDEITRREIYLSDKVTRLFGVNLHDLDELGYGQEYQVFFEDVLGGSVANGDREIVIGLDLSSNDSFVMPIKRELRVFPDPTMHRQQRVGFYGWQELGFGVLDTRRVILGSF